MKRTPGRLPLLASLLSVSIALCLTACASRQPRVIPVGEEVPITKTTFSFDMSKLEEQQLPSYRIAAGDQLDILFQIRTWIQKEDFKIAVDHTVEVKFVHAPELNQSQRVRPDGTLSLPYIGDVFVIGKSPSALTAELKERYSKVLRSAQLYVVIPDFRSAIKELKTDLHTAPRGLSRLVTVRPDGHVTFPMLGDLLAAGRTIPEMNKELNLLYEKYLPGLNCDLFLETHAGSVIYVQGEVKNPGVYNILKSVSVLEAITLAGSWTPSARTENVIVVRKQQDKLVATRIDLRKSLDLSGKGAFFYLQPDDIVLVPKTGISEAADIARDIASIVMFRGWGINLSYGLNNLVTVEY